MFSYSQVSEYVVNNIYLSGNHITKEKIVLRELTFSPGDTISCNDLEDRIMHSRENILNTSLFNYATITAKTVDTSFLDISISVEERWYTWPAPILKYEDRNFSAWLKSGDLSKSKYGLSLQKFNCFGRRESLKFTLLLGYVKQFAVSYRNIAIGGERKHFIGGEIEFTTQNEIITETRNNEPMTFKNSLHSVFEQRKYTINYMFRPYIYEIHNLYLNYLEYNIADTIIKINPDYLGKGQNHMECFTLDYVYTNDRRDSKAYPLKGSYFELLVGETMSLPATKNPFISTVILPNFFKFFPIGKNLYYAGGISLKLSYSNNYSYLYSKSLGYIYNMHGFEYNTIEGQHFIVLKNLLKFTVLKPRVSVISFIPLQKFNKIHYGIYFNLFTDCGYVSNKYATPDNTYANKFLFSTGAGLDLVTYYDRTLRAEYSINGFGQGGFYLNLTAPINK
jgi:outer membrane protein assembly factor BamA